MISLKYCCMDYFTYYDSPIGKIILFERDEKLTKLLFFDEFKISASDSLLQRDTDLFKECKRWLDIYFSKKIPDFKLPLQIYGTEFQKDIYNIFISSGRHGNRKEPYTINYSVSQSNQN